MTCKLLNPKKEVQITKKSLEVFIKKVFLVSKLDTLKKREILQFVDELFENKEHHNEEEKPTLLPLNFKRLNTLKMNQFVKPGTKDVLTPIQEDNLKKLDIPEVSSSDNTPVFTEKKDKSMKGFDKLTNSLWIKGSSPSKKNEEILREKIEEIKEEKIEIIEETPKEEKIEIFEEIKQEEKVEEIKLNINEEIKEEKIENVPETKEEKLEEVKETKEEKLEDVKEDIKDKIKEERIKLRVSSSDETLEKRIKNESPTIVGRISFENNYYDLNLRVGSLTDTHKHDTLFGPKRSSLTNLKDEERKSEEIEYKDQKTFSLHTRTNSTQEYQDFVKKITGEEEKKKEEPFDVVYSGAFNLVEIGLTIQRRIQKEKEEREQKKNQLTVRKSFQVEIKKEKIGEVEKRLSTLSLDDPEKNKKIEKLTTKDVLDSCVNMMEETHGFAWDLVRIGERIRQFVFEKKSLLELAREKKDEIKAEIREKAIEKAEEIRERAIEKAEELKERALEFKEKTNKFKEDFREKAKDFKEDIKEKAKDFKEDIREKAKDFSEDIREKAKDLTQRKNEKQIKLTPLKMDSLKVEDSDSDLKRELFNSPKRDIETVSTELKNITLDENEEKEDHEQKQKNKLEQMLDHQKEWLNQKINLMSHNHNQNQPSISITELLDKGKKNYHFLNCFGLFDVTSFLTDALDEIALWELNDIEFKFGKPIIEGLIKGNTGDEYVKIENGFMNVYYGKKDSLEIKNQTPNLSLNLREAIVRDKKYTDEEEAFKITVNLVDFRFYVKTKEIVEKWIWVIRMNSGFHRYKYNSFSPVRKNTGCQFLHCGKDYFSELSECIKQAKTDIFICGWLVTPYLYLKRNPHKDRLDELLLAKAKEGVKIYILLWKDPGSSLIIDNGSIEAEIYFNSLHDNIYCIRDPPSFGLIIWSHHQKCAIIDQDVCFIGGIDVAYNRYEDPETFLLFDEKEDVYPGMDYVNPLLRMKTTGDFTKSYFDRKQEPRLPWNDIQVKIVGMAARDVSRNFIERWNFCVQSSKSSKPLIVLSSNQYININEKYNNCKVQILRSASSWGFGLDIVEKSIYDATIEIIEKAKSFIYIENQFFISGSKEKQLYPKNKITQSLINKVRNAIKNKQEFKIIIMLPLQTAAPIKDKTTLVITYWQYMSIYRGEDSFFGLLQKEFPKVDISKYVTFTSMRNWSYVGEDKINATTEIVYIHSKMMIVDDRYVIIGSANINDRSMTGGRDSEIAAIIEDTEKIEIKMNGEVFIGNKFAHELRLSIWEKYLQRKKEDFADPILFFNEWVDISNNNTDIYNKVFGMIHSTIKNENDLHFLTEHNQILKAKNLELLESIKGFIVTFPRDFLSENSKAKGIAISDSQENLYYM